MSRISILMIIALLLVALPALAQIEEHQEIEGPFSDGPSVTATCLECHDDVGHDFMQTTHWTWSSAQELAGRDGKVELGKVNAINNYCISVDGNWPRCTSCHAGYGWKDGGFDFTNAGNIDCLVCHDTTGEYKKFPTGAGHPAYEPKEFGGKAFTPPNLLNVAQNVGPTSRRTCGACHFFGGGGDGVKHGDMDKSLIAPDIEIDIHMSPAGQDLSCQDCHKTEAHDISGNALVVSPGGANHIDCTDCHEGNPHKKMAKIYERHMKKVACQTCHIPTIAKGAATKVWWDWSTAGTDLTSEKDEYGLPTFVKKKGSFTWDKNYRPAYAWYNGTGGAYIAGDKMDPAEVTTLNWPNGDRDDSEAKIYPFKLMRGKQPYDSVNNTFITPKLFGKTGFWKTFDWNDAAAQGMKVAGLDYSGEFDFAETLMYWKINHGVAPKKQALKCTACHGKKGDRMDWEALGYDGDPKKKKKDK